MAKFLEDIYRKYFWTETPEDWDAVFVAAKEAGVPMTGEVARWREYRELVLLSSAHGWAGNESKRWAPYSITTQDVLAVLRLEKLCKEKPGLKEAIKKAEGLGIRPGVEVEWVSGSCRSKPFIVPEYSLWRTGDNRGWYWMTKDGAPNTFCWIVSKGDPEWNARPTGKSAIVNQPFGFVSSVDLDNEIRVGDTVKVIRPTMSSGRDLVGKHGVVNRTDGEGIDVRFLDWEGGHNGSYQPLSKTRNAWNCYLKDLKKVTNAGGRSSTTNNQTHGQVHREFEGQGIGCGEGQAVRAGSSKSRIAVGFQPVGDPLKARTGKGRIAVAQILHEPIRSGYL